MKKYFFIVAMMALALILSYHNLAAQAYTLAPDFKLEDLDKNIFTLSSCKDKNPVILFFWATWCPYCRKELKILNEMNAELKKEGIEVLAIDVNEPFSRVDNFVKNNQLNFKVFLDSKAAAAEDYGLIGLPTYILVDKKGYIRFIGFSFPKEKYKELIK